MKVALIPPIPELPFFATGDLHLLLTDQFEQAHYRNHYLVQRHKGAYLILDNSAHENGAGDKASEIRNQAIFYNAQEVVVPDVLEDGPGTIEGAIAAIEEWFEGGRKAMRDLNPALMYVPQGSDYEDWQECLRTLTRLHKHTAKKHNLRRNFVIGVSKDYEVWDGGIERLLSEDISPLRNYLINEGITIQVHLLGWGRQLWKLRELAARFPWLRSTDSAKPFVFARGGIDLREHLDSEPPVYPTRPSDYFTQPLAQHEREVAWSNVGVFRMCAA